VAGGRPKRTLVDRVLDRSFRPVRYGQLLEEPLLPERAPFEDEERALIWAELRNLQSWWQLYDDDDERTRLAIAQEFSALVQHLHGGRQPLFYRELVEARQTDSDDE
jgi:hypothetical protein